VQIEEEARQHSASKLFVKQQHEKEENEKLAQQLDSLENNDELLAGLDELHQQEVAQLEQTKQMFTPRNEKKEGSDVQGQGQQNNNEEPQKQDQQSGSGLGPMATVAIAIGVAGVAYLTRKLWWNN